MIVVMVYVIQRLVRHVRHALRIVGLAVVVVMVHVMQWVEKPVLPARLIAVNALQVNVSNYALYSCKALKMSRIALELNPF
jgi:hypothetical protein